MDGSDKLKCARGGGIGGGGVGHSVDRLSALPDDLLHAVLSRLKARQVVRTCVLSTRWRDLWRSVPCLRIDQREFHTAAAGNGTLVERQSFNNFAHILLHRHDVALLEEFRLHEDPGPGYGYGYGYGRFHADSWVRHGISQDETWPCRLERLHLNNVSLDSYFARHISSRCPALEDMRLKNCCYLLTEVTKITSSSLKKLVIVGFHVVREDASFRLILEAPALASLRLAGHSSNNYSDVMSLTTVTSMPSLVDASICLTTVREFNYSNEDNGRIEMQLSLLNELFNVTSLHLSRFGVMFLVLGGDAGLFLPEFKNLKMLSLAECDISDDFLTLKHFLRNSPNLEKLTLRCLPLFFAEVQVSIGINTSILFKAVRYVDYVPAKKNVDYVLDFSSYDL
ncbi:hypothetical protein CFC21_038503 [Triticum aestivum]|uniref:F-box domain-containing protein n=3 Tax=Triticum TaxID=4564 RepID=A0A9R0S0V9_TRITD|nr:hypothetical protein CFC21_038503 [Triticum aestivum]VAH69972.1 unnamed protein product [Triticum turgidum subsp. durum]